MLSITGARRTFHGLHGSGGDLRFLFKERRDERFKF